MIWKRVFSRSPASSEDPLVDLSEVLNTDDDILGMLSGDLVKPGDDSGRWAMQLSVRCKSLSVKVSRRPSALNGMLLGPPPPLKPEGQLHSQMHYFSLIFFFPISPAYNLSAETCVLVSCQMF